MVEKDSGFPYYIQIYQKLRERILIKEYLPGETNHAENPLVKEFVVTRAPV